MLSSQAVNKEFLTELHQRLQNLLRPRLQQTIEDLMERDQTTEKLSRLDKRVAETPHSWKHEAWRPSGLVEGVKFSTAAHDLKVATEEKKRLEDLLEQLDNEVNTLERQVKEGEADMINNTEIIKRKQEALRDISDKLNAVQE